MKRRVLLPFALVTASCQVVTGDFAVGTGDADSGGGAGDGATTGDSGAPDGSGATDGGSGGASADAMLDASDAAPTWHDMTGSAFWTTFDTTTVAANAQAYFGGAFDGRYVYFVPQAHTVACRFDTTASFSSAGSWQTFDTAGINTATVQYRGGAFDGRYVYLVPFYDSTATVASGVVARFDTMASFSTAASWATFNTSTVASSAEGYDGAAFDGRYLYFVPHFNGTAARYDTQSSFAASSSWVTFDATSLNSNAQGFLGAVFDGRYVYLVPQASGGHAILTRYDTQSAAFSSSGSWSTFDIASLNSGAGFLGGAFDGQRMYLAPFTGSLAEVYDPPGGLAGSSFTSFNLAGLSVSAAGYGGAGFDGRFVYMVPFYSSVVARYDTRAVAFGMAQSWATYELGADAGAHASFAGGVFDGEFMYFVPSANGIVARFDAKTPASMPKLPGWNGSFL